MDKLTPIALVLIVIGFAGVEACRDPAPLHPFSDADAAPEEKMGDAVIIAPEAAPVCVDACLNLETLGCPEAHLGEGRSCVEVCSRAEWSDYFSMRPDCIAAAKSVTEVRLCNVRCLTK